MSNGHVPQHNPRRAERLTSHVPVRRRLADRAVSLWRRMPRWAKVTAVAVAQVLALAGAVEAGHAGGHHHAEHPHAAETVVREVTPQHCLEAMARADDAFAMAEEFGQGMASFHTEALALSEFLAPGDAGRPVRQLQERLNDSGHDIEVDGDYGPRTKSAVEEFRDKHGEHAADSEAFLGELGELKKRYHTAKLGCQLRPPKPTRGGGS